MSTENQTVAGVSSENQTVFGFDPRELNVYHQEVSTSSNNNIYKPMPKFAKSDDSVYRAQIKVIYNPFDFKASVIEKQTYWMQDIDGYFSADSSLMNNDKNCPIFKAWKTLHYSDDESKKELASKYFDKRFARYVTIQVIEDNNQPELVGKYMFWKVPKCIWENIDGKMNPSADSKKPSIPIMDFLFGRAIDLEVKPGPKDAKAPERETREISYTTSSITEDVVSCINSDKTLLLTEVEQGILDTYTEAVNKLNKMKDVAKREAELQKLNNENENTKKLREIYRTVLEKVKQECPNIKEELGYKPWDSALTARVTNYITMVKSGKNPAATLNVEITQAVSNTEEVEEKATDDNDLPF